VTLVIASILLAIAVPSYTSQVRKSRRTDARSALMDLATREERFLSLNNSYTQDPTSLGYAGAFPVSVGSGYYQIAAPTVAAATAGPPATVATFSLTATPVGNQAKDTQCASFSLDSTGKQSSLDSGGNDSTTACWN
jgi:type IV pilus assembly protein PilE